MGEVNAGSLNKTCRINDKIEGLSVVVPYAETTGEELLALWRQKHEAVLYTVLEQRSHHVMYDRCY